MDKEKIQAIRDRQAQKESEAKQQAQQDKVASTLNNLLVATMVSKDPKMIQVAKNLGDLLKQIGEASQQFKKSSLHLLPIANKDLSDAVTKLADKVEKYSSQDLQPLFLELTNQISKVASIKPVVNLPKQAVSVDLSPLLDAVKDLQSEVSKNKIDIPKTDLTRVVDGLSKIQSAIDNQRFPVPNYILPFKDSSGKAVQAIVNSNGELVVSSEGGGASSGSTVGVDVTGSATLIKAANSDRKSIVLGHESSSTLYVGKTSSVTTSGATKGLPVVANQLFGYDDYTGAVYGISGSGTITVSYDENV